jgi:mono/diheme cytochrome c family protein
MDWRAFGVAIAVAAAGGVLAIGASSIASALPAYVSQTGQACGACHTNPAGGGPLTALGDAFAANGRKLPGKK